MKTSSITQADLFTRRNEYLRITRKIQEKTK